MKERLLLALPHRQSVFIASRWRAGLTTRASSSISPETTSSGCRAVSARQKLLGRLAAANLHWQVLLGYLPNLPPGDHRILLEAAADQRPDSDQLDQLETLRVQCAPSHPHSGVFDASPRSRVPVYCPSPSAPEEDRYRVRMRIRRRVATAKQIGTEPIRIARQPRSVSPPRASSSRARPRPFR